MCIRCHSVNLRHLFSSLLCDCAHTAPALTRFNFRLLLLLFLWSCCFWFCSCCCCCLFLLVRFSWSLSLHFTDIIIVRLKRYKNQRINEDDYIHHLFYNASTRPPIIKYKYIRAHILYRALLAVKSHGIGISTARMLMAPILFFIVNIIHFKYLFAPMTRAIQQNPATLHTRIISLLLFIC